MCGQLGFLCDECAEKNKIKISMRRRIKRKMLSLESKVREPAIQQDIGVVDTDTRDHANRGDYCISCIMCRKQRSNPKCLDCDDFLPIFKGVDPGRSFYGWIN